jgi:predicted phage terminase large subunit-like protein
LSDDKANLQGWNVKQSVQVGYFGAGVGGTIIGFGASNVAITDDLYKGIEDALSDTVNDRVHQWKTSTHDSRLETGCARIDIGTRWTKNDVIGQQMETQFYDRSIIVPALDANNVSFCEAVMTTDEYLDKRKRTAPEIWEAEYQQQPIDVKGLLFNNLKFINNSEFEELIVNKKSETNPLGYDGCIGYIDVADQGNDYLAMAIVAIVDRTFFVVDYVFTRQNTDVTLGVCAEKLNRWDVNYCRVESNSMGAMFSRQLQQLTQTKILQVHNTVNKETRVIMQSVFIMQRFTFVQYENNPEYLLFINNVFTYSTEGKNKNDDAPDCLAGLSIFTQSMFKNLL